MEKLEQLVSEMYRCYDAKDYQAAQRAARQVLEIDPQHAVALRVVGVTIREDDPQQSRQHLERAAELDPRSAGTRFELGVTLMRINCHREAYDQFLRAVEIKPNFQAAYINLAAIAQNQMWHEQCLSWARRALALKPDCALSYYNMSNALRDLGDMAASTDCLHRAVECDPHFIKAHWNLGINYLLSGNFRDGWRLFEHREGAEEVEIDQYPQPRWNGQPLEGKTILVHGEQGIGDEILFATCFADVIARAGKLVVLCEPRLARLFARSFPQATVYGYQRRPDHVLAPLGEAIDYQIPAGSLMMHFRTSWESFPRARRILLPDAAAQCRWRQRLDELGPGLKVGISWRAGGKPLERVKRSVPLGEPWREVLTVPGVQFVNLQYSDSTADLAAAEELLGVKIHDWEDGDPLVDMDTYAAKIAALDLVISVGNATVHVAGAVGTPAWAMLPTNPSWRWLLEGDTTPWYASVRLFRQQQPGQWQPVFARVADELRRLVAADPPAPRPALPASESDSAAAPGAAHRRGQASDRWLEAEEYSAKAMIENLNTKMNEAGRAFQQGAHELAEKLYREVLQVVPRHALALYGLGEVARLSGRLELAIRSLQRAVASFDRSPLYWNSLGSALAAAGRDDEALLAYRQAIQVDPAFSPAHRELGLLMQRLNGHELALEHFCKSLALSPDEPALHVHRGRSLAALCRLDEAEQCLHEALRLAPDFVDAYLALGELYLEDQRYDEAERALRQVLSDKPDHAQAWYQLGRARYLQAGAEEAVEHFQRAVDLDAQYLPAVLALGAARRELGQPEAAVDVFREALKLRPESAEIRHSLGQALADLGCHRQALDEFAEALQLDPRLAGAHVGRALSLLQTGRFAEGWREYEWRWQQRGGARPRNFFTQPAWDGSPLAGKSLLIHGEQAIGDELMFASCYAEVIEQAAQATILCDPRLEKLFRRSFPRATVIAVTRGREHQWRPPAGLRFDVQIAAGSLPNWLRPTAASFPRQRQFLQADPARAGVWRERLGTLGPGWKVGIAWRAGEQPRERRLRGTELSQWAELLSLPGVHWINLQHGEVRGELAAAGERGQLIHDWPDGTHLRDIDELAARMGALDLVIAPANTAIHLAGALGTPAWALVPKFAGWRWLTDRQDSVWYGSVRLFRQSVPNDWAEVLGRVRQELLKRQAGASENNQMPAVGPPHWIAAARDGAAPAPEPLGR